MIQLLDKSNSSLGMPEFIDVHQKQLVCSWVYRRNRKVLVGPSLPRRAGGALSPVQWKNLRAGGPLLPSWVAALDGRGQRQFAALPISRAGIRLFRHLRENSRPRCHSVDRTREGISDRGSRSGY